MENDRNEILTILSKLKNSSDDYVDEMLSIYINSYNNIYSDIKRPELDKKLELTDEFKSKCLLLDEYVYDPIAHDEFAINSKFIYNTFNTQDFRNKLVNYEQKDFFELKMPLDIKVILFSFE